MNPTTPDRAVSPETAHKAAEEFVVGSEDPDFVLRPAGTPQRPFVCYVPVIGGMLPQCR